MDKNISLWRQLCSPCRAYAICTPEVLNVLLFPLSAGMVQQEARSFFTQPEVISPEQLPVFKWNNPGANFGTPAHGLHVTMFESQLAVPINS